MFLMQGLSRNFGMLLAAVMVGSVGASVHLTLSVSLVSDLLPPQHARYLPSLPKIKRDQNPQSRQGKRNHIYSGYAAVDSGLGAVSK